MSENSPRRIRKATPALAAEVNVPPSKSYTNRALIVAALADGDSVIHNASASEDSQLMVQALRQFGVRIDSDGNRLRVEGTGGTLRTPSEPVFAGNAGTVIRFLTSVASLVPGQTILTGNDDMQRRPLGDLLDALRSAGVKSSSNNGYPPVTIHGGSFGGGRIDINSHKSSQYLSSILLASPYARRPVVLHAKGQVSSVPYIDMSIRVMRSFGVEVIAVDLAHYIVENNQRYIGHEFTVDADATSASYFFAAAAITGARVRVTNLAPDSVQGDMKFLDVLTDMGCRVNTVDGAIEVQGGILRGIDVDMNAMPDCVPTLAVVAAFADGPTTITNIEHLRYKETDRIHAVATELRKLGAQVDVFDEGISIHPRPLHGGVVDTYNDHRIAMSFALAGLRVGGIEIAHPSCVQKSFPEFWKEFEQLESRA